MTCLAGMHEGPRRAAAIAAGGGAEIDSAPAGWLPNSNPPKQSEKPEVWKPCVVVVTTGAPSETSGVMQSLDPSPTVIWPCRRFKRRKTEEESMGGYGSAYSGYSSGGYSSGGRGLYRPPEFGGALYILFCVQGVTHISMLLVVPPRSNKSVAC
jgi:hypothetical protein